MTIQTSLYDWILLNADGGGAGGGGENGDGGAGGGGENGDGGAENGGNENGDGGDGGEGGSGPYRPEGLSDSLFGETDQRTIDKMAAAIQGYRQKDNERGVPGELADYSKFPDDVPETIKPLVSALGEDTAFQKVAETAQKEGVPVKTLQKLTTTFYQAAEEMGFLEPLVDVEAEKAALVPEDAKNLPEAEQRVAREKRMSDNYAFIDQMTASEQNKAGMPPDVAEYVKASLGDTAKGHQFFEYMRSQISGGNKIAGGDQANGGQDAYAALQARIREPKNNPDHRDFDKTSYEQLKKDLQAYHAQNAT